MLRRNERWIIHYNAVIKSVPADGPVTTAPFVALSRLGALRRNGNAWQKIANDTFVLRLADLSFEHQEWIALLVNIGDPKVSNPGAINMQTGDVRTTKLRKAEAVAYATHILIKRTATLTPSGVSVYPVLMEDVPGLGKTRVEPFLNHLLGMVELSFKDQNNKPQPYRPRISLTPMLSEGVIDQLTRGRLMHFELIRDEAGESLDQHGLLKRKQSVLRVKANLETVDGQPATTMQRIVDLAHEMARQNDYSFVRIVYKPPVGSQRTVKSSAAREDVMDIMQARYELVETEVDLAQCHRALVPELVEKMRALHR